MLYGVLIASSSAALILPAIGSLHLGGTRVVRLAVQVAIANLVCIVALPLAIDPANAVRSALGGLGIAAAALLLFVVLRVLDRKVPCIASTRRRESGSSHSNFD